LSLGAPSSNIERRTQARGALIVLDPFAPGSAEPSRRHSEDRQAFLLELSDALRTSADEEAIGVLCTRLLAEHLHLDRAYFVRFYPEEDRAWVGPEYRRADLQPISGNYRLSEYPETVCKIQRETLVFTDTGADPRLPEAEQRALSQLDLGGWIVAPVRKGEGSLIWALGGATATPRAWSREEILLIEDVAERAWFAVERARAEESLRHKNEALEGIQTRADETPHAGEHRTRNLMAVVRSIANRTMRSVRDKVKRGKRSMSDSSTPF
jgi:GAF domain-containing protein